ncbi:Glucagon receptor [Collichthys lucidus]|uniref:Glucagon receptor n=1 Tax=Collichthys lucidus TaxID=240159 RepID=A0A4U5V0L7_COLLU|nr:Glucagon receptor [Collichthys lucidus]
MTSVKDSGATCSRMFDMYACWSDGKPNSTVKVPCPWYLPWYNQGETDGDLSPLQSHVHGGLLPQSGQSLSGSRYSAVLQEVALHQKLHPHQLVCIVHPASGFHPDQRRSAEPRHRVQTRQEHLRRRSGTPVLFVIPWIIVRYLFENTRCWEINENKGHWWIIRAPILLAILVMCTQAETLSAFQIRLNQHKHGTETSQLLVIHVNFFIFIRIIHILVSKLKAHQMRYTDYKFRLAKSTLTLIPLLGIHEVVFAVLTEEPTDGVLNDISLFFELFLNSFQGLLVAILYCFVNKEVQAEIKKKWQRWKLGMTDLEDLRNTGSNTPQVGTSMPLPIQCQHPSPCLPPTHRLENDCPSGPPLHTKPLLPQPCTHQDQLEATQPKTYCCISALRQDDGGGNEKSAIRLSDRDKQIQCVETVHQLKDLDSSIENIVDPVEGSQSTDRVDVADCDL